MSHSVHKSDVAIYAAEAHAFYDKASVHPEEGGGGAEFQTVQMADGLAQLGFSVAHIVYPLTDPAPSERVKVVERAEYMGNGGPLAKLRESVAIWRALKKANARVYVLRAYGLHLIVGAVFIRVHRRKWVMSGSNDLEFTPELRGPWPAAKLYRWSIGTADSIIAQSDQQREIAEREFPQVKSFDVIPSFAEPAEPTQEPGRAFLWAGRLVDYKRPLEYVNLARCVPEAKFRMICVETNETPGLGEQVRAEAEKTPNLELMASRPRAELMELMNSSVAVVVTSESEGMPNVFLEAWARGIPVLTLSFDPDGKIAQRRMGLSADDSRERFIAGARRLWEDSELRARLGASGREYVMETHSPRVIAKRWDRALRFLLD